MNRIKQDVRNDQRRECVWQQPAKQLVTYKLPGKDSIAQRIQQSQMREKDVKALYDRSHLAAKFHAPRADRAHNRATFRIDHHPVPLAHRMERHKEIAAPVPIPGFTDLPPRTKK